MKLYIANKNYSSWSLRPWVLMRTLEIEFEEILKPFPMGGGASGFDAFSPTGKVPVLVDQAKAGAEKIITKDGRCQTWF
jgi:glutathione S-transferase